MATYIYPHRDLKIATIAVPTAPISVGTCKILIRRANLKAIDTVPAPPISVGICKVSNRPTSLKVCDSFVTILPVISSGICKVYKTSPYPKRKMGDTVVPLNRGTPISLEFVAVPPTSSLVPFDVQFVNNSVVPVETWNWDFGDGSLASPLKNPLHNYSGLGSYHVNLTSNGFEYIRYDFIKIDPIYAIFSVNRTDTCIGDRIQFTDQSYGSPTNWDWDFGDGSPHSFEQNPKHVYTITGPKTVTLTISKPGNSNTLTKTNYISVFNDLIILNSWEKIANTSSWTARWLHRCITVNGYIYLSGGIIGGTERDNDVWRSPDGLNWELLTDSAPWTARAAHGFVYYNSKFWIMGGSSTSGVMLHDYWSSDDCVTWTSHGDAPWGGRHEFGVCVHSGKIFISGGFNSSALLSDVWSFDGSTWVRTTTNFGEGVREHVMLSFLGRLWIFGGNVDNAPFYINTIRSSYDGVYWAYEGDAAWAGRREHQIVVMEGNDRLILAGGYTGTYKNDIWYSNNGTTWTSVPQTAPYTPRSDYGFVLLHGKVYIIGGQGSLLNDVWESTVTLSVDFVGVPRSGYQDLITQFTDTTVGGPYMWDWDFGDGSPHSTYQDPVHTYETPGFYSVTLIATRDNLESSVTKVGYIRVDSAVSVSGIHKGYKELTASLNGSCIYPVISWSWDLGDGNTSNQQNPIHTYQNAGRYTLIISANTGSRTYTLIKENFVIVEKLVDFEADTLSGYPTLPVQFTNLLSFIPDIYSWDLGDGSHSSEPNPLNNYTDIGNHNVSLSVTKDPIRALFLVDNTSATDVEYPTSFWMEGNYVFVTYARGSGASASTVLLRCYYYDGSGLTLRSEIYDSPVTTTTYTYGFNSICSDGTYLYCYSGDSYLLAFSFVDGLLVFLASWKDYNISGEITYHNGYIYAQSASSEVISVFTFNGTSFSLVYGTELAGNKIAVSDNYIFATDGYYSDYLIVLSFNGVVINYLANMYQGYIAPINMCADGNYLFVGYSDYSNNPPQAVRVFYYDGVTFAQVSVIDDINDTAYVAFSDGYLYVASVNEYKILGNDRIIVYTFNGSTFTKVAERTIDYLVSSIYASGNTLFVGGTAAGIRIYELMTAPITADKTETKNSYITLNPISLPEADPTTGTPPQLVQFSDTVNPVGSIWEWNFDDGSPTSNLQNPDHTYVVGGNFNPTLDKSVIQRTDTTLSTNNAVDVNGWGYDLWSDGTYVYIPYWYQSYLMEIYYYDGSTLSLATTAFPGDYEGTDICSDGTYLYIASWTGVIASTMYNGSDITELDRTTTPDRPVGICTHNGFVFILEWFGVSAYSFNGVSWQELNYCDLAGENPLSGTHGGDAHGICATDTHVFATFGDNGLKLMSWNGTYLQFLDAYNPGGVCFDIDTDGTYVYVTWNNIRRVIALEVVADKLKFVAEYPVMSGDMCITCKNGLICVSCSYNNYVWDINGVLLLTFDGTKFNRIYQYDYVYKDDGIYASYMVNDKIFFHDSSWATVGVLDINSTPVPATSHEILSVSLVVLEANFTASPVVGYADLTVIFVDTSTGDPIAWEWDFGDGSPHSYEQNPTHVFTGYGSYTISLTAQSMSMLDTETKINYITVVSRNIPEVTPASEFGGGFIRSRGPSLIFD